MGLSKENKKDGISFFVSIVLGIGAILAIKSIFDDDDSKIISKKGRSYLSDPEKMKKVNEIIDEANNDKETYNEIIINF